MAIVGGDTPLQYDATMDLPLTPTTHDCVVENISKIVFIFDLLLPACDSSSGLTASIEV